MVISSFVISIFFSIQVQLPCFSMVLAKADLSTGEKHQVIQYKDRFFYLSALITLYLIFFPPKLGEGI